MRHRLGVKVGIVTAIGAVLASIGAAPAAAHYTGPLVTAKHAVRDAGPKPTCANALSSRTAWADRVADLATPSSKDQDAVIRTFFTHLQLCEGEDFTFNGQRVDAPKTSGTALPFDFDFGGTHVDIADDQKLETLSGVTAKAARTHGVCTVNAYAPSYQSFNNSTFTHGNITCSGTAQVKVTLALLRKYNSTGNVVVWEEQGPFSDSDGTVSHSFYKACAPASTWAGRTYGQRYHYPDWASAYAFSSYVAACP